MFAKYRRIESGVRLTRIVGKFYSIDRFEKLVLGRPLLMQIEQRECALCSAIQPMLIETIQAPTRYRPSARHTPLTMTPIGNVSVRGKFQYFFFTLLKWTNVFRRMCLIASPSHLLWSVEPGRVDIATNMMLCWIFPPNNHSLWFSSV